jgi:hypothetical protein
MASEILGLFASPELYQQQRDAAMQQQAAQLAQLDPYSNVRFGAIRAGQTFGTGIANLLGAEDPQLKIITARQNVMRNVDPANPQSIANAAEALMRAGDQQGALTLADYARKAQSETALAAQRSREGRAAATPKELQIAAARAELQGALRDLQTLPQSPERDAQIQTVKDTLDSLPVGGTRQVPDSIEISKELALEAGPEGSDAYNKAYRENLRKLSTEKSSEKQLEFSRILQEAGYAVGSPDYVAKMREYAAAEISGRKTGKGTNVELKLPGQGKSGVAEVPEFRGKVENTIKPFMSTITASDSALENIKDSIKTGNFISFNAARVQLAKALGDSTLSRKDIEQAGGDPSLIGGFFDATSTLFTGTPSVDTQRKIESTLKAIRKVARNKANAELEVQKGIAEESGFNSQQMQKIFNFPTINMGGKAPATPAAPAAGKSQTRTLKSGKTVIVEQE